MSQVDYTISPFKNIAIGGSLGLGESGKPIECYDKALDVEFYLDCFDGKTGGCILIATSDNEGNVKSALATAPGCPYHKEGDEIKVYKVLSFNTFNR